MALVQKSLRIPKKIIKEIQQIAKDMQKDFSSTANELLEEAVKLHCCPGILFTEGVTGRRARVAGTGIEVWEIIATYESIGKSLHRLRQAYYWLTDQQLKAALGYYKAYPDEIDRLIVRNESWTPQRVHKRHPFLPTGNK